MSTHNVFICLSTWLLLLEIRNISSSPSPDVGMTVEHSADEVRFPNGTVVGKYSYVDAQGNPVHVRYFADDSNYGVELRSMKIFEPNLFATSANAVDQTRIKDRTIEAESEQKLSDYNNTLNDIMTNVYNDQGISTYDEKNERRSKKKVEKNVDLHWNDNKVKEYRFGYGSNEARRIKRKRRDLYNFIRSFTGKNMKAFHTPI